MKKRKTSEKAHENEIMKKRERQRETCQGFFQQSNQIHKIDIIFHWSLFTNRTRT